MIYVDSSVLLAHLFAEVRRPPEHLWEGDIVSSRLLEYEVWVVLHSRFRAESLREQARELLQGVGMVDLWPIALERALEPFPVPLRTLDALHLATLSYLFRQQRRIELATYDQRMAAAAGAMGISVVDLLSEPSANGS